LCGIPKKRREGLIHPFPPPG